MNTVRVLWCLSKEAEQIHEGSEVNALDSDCVHVTYVNDTQGFQHETYVYILTLRLVLLNK